MLFYQPAKERESVQRTHGPWLHRSALAGVVTATDLHRLRTFLAPWSVESYGSAAFSSRPQVTVRTYCIPFIPSQGAEWPPGHALGG